MTFLFLLDSKHMKYLKEKYPLQSKRNGNWRMNMCTHLAIGLEKRYETHYTSFPSNLILTNFQLH